MKMFTSMRTWAIGCYPKVFFTKLCACSFTKKWYYYRCSVVNLGKYFRTDITNKQLPLLLQTADLNFSHQVSNIYVCVCLRPSTVKASSVWNSWDCQGTDQRCCVEDVGFFCRFPSSLLWNAESNLSASRFILFVH